VFFILFLPKFDPSKKNWWQVWVKMETKRHSQRLVCLGWQKTDQCCSHLCAIAVCKHCMYLASGCGSTSETCMISDFCGGVNEICSVFGFYAVYNPKTVQFSCLKQCVYLSSSFVFWRIIKLESGEGRRKCAWRIGWRTGLVLAMTTSQENWKCFATRMQFIYESIFLLLVNHWKLLLLLFKRNTLLW